MHRFLHGLVFFLAGFAWANAAEEQPLIVEVVDPYIEMHSGPGRGYPIFHVVDRGEPVEILFRQTDWFKIRTQQGKEGWVQRGQMVMTLTPAGERLEIKDTTQEEFIQRKWEYGVTLGDFDNSTVVTFSATHHFTENISTELSLSQVLGTASSSTLLGASIVHQPFPEWTVSPFFTLGTGIKDTKPKRGVVGIRDGSDLYSNVGLGVRMHFTQRFFLRAEFRKYVIFASRDDNEEIDEWKAGFGFFF